MCWFYVFPVFFELEFVYLWSGQVRSLDGSFFLILKTSGESGEKPKQQPKQKFHTLRTERSFLSLGTVSAPFLLKDCAISLEFFLIQSLHQEEERSNNIQSEFPED